MSYIFVLVVKSPAQNNDKKEKKSKHVEQKWSFI